MPTVGMPYSSGMSYRPNGGGFRLFPGSPSIRGMLSRDYIRTSWRAGGPVITCAIILLCVAVWVVELLLRLFSSGAYSSWMTVAAFNPTLAVTHPWTFITSLFLHAPSVLHVLFNMLTLWAVGPLLERLMGHGSFLGLYLLSGVGGGAGLMVWAALTPDGTGWAIFAYGASGALFGLFAALLVVYHRSGSEMRSMLIWMAINFLMPLLIPGIAWQAHVGGFVVGGLLTWLLVGGLPALRRRPLGTRSWVYGTVLLLVCIAVILACDGGNPAGSLGTQLGGDGAFV